MKHRYAPTTQNLPAIRRHGDRLILEDHFDGPYRAVAAAQLGFQYLLCHVLPPREMDAPSVLIGGLASSFPCVRSLRPAIAASEGIPANRYFGGCHPESGPAVMEISGSMNLFDGGNVPIGEAQALAGGAEGLIAFPQFRFCAKTTEGLSTNQEDGCYIAHFRLPGKPRVFLKAGFDGLGKPPMGELAQSAAIQGVHALLVQALSEGRIPYPHELMEAAARAADAQVHFLERTLGKKYEDDNRPDTVGSITMVIGDLVLIASSGDFPVLISERGDDGSVRTIGYTHVDETRDYAVWSTIRSRNAKFYAIRIKPKTWITACSDGVLQNILGSFKNRMSWDVRDALFEALPDQGFFHNLNSILENTPPERAAKALHDIALSGPDIPGYPALALPVRYPDNLTAMTLSIDDAPETGLAIPPNYRTMERVTRAQQFHYETAPDTLYLPESLPEISLGGAEHPEGKPMMVMANAGLAPRHARIFRDGDQYFVELLADGLPLEIRRSDGAQKLTTPGDAAPLSSRDALVFSDAMILEVRLPHDDEDDKTPTMRRK